MITDKKLIDIKALKVKAKRNIKLKSFSTKYSGKILTKQDSELLL